MATWATHSTPSLGAETILDMICVGSGKYVACGTNGLLLTSANSGVTWTTRSTAEATNTWTGLAFDGTTVVMVGLSGVHRVAVSTDFGVTWTLKTAAAANQWQSVTSAAFIGAGVFLAVSSDGATRTMKSTDSGATWVGHAAASVASWAGVAASGSLAMAIDETCTATMKTADGVTWNAVSSPASFTRLGAPAGGSNFLVYSSTLSKFAIGGNNTGAGAKVAFTTDGSAYTYTTAAPLTTYEWLVAFVAAPSIGGFVGSLPFNTSISPTPTIIGNSIDGGATWTAENTTLSGQWSIAAWDDTNKTVVIWDGTPNPLMLVGAFANPTVTSISPDHGPATGGTVVALTGTDLGGITAVAFNGTAATGVSAVSSTSATCITPAHAVGPVTVTAS